MLEEFIKQYEIELIFARKKYPHHFIWPITELRNVVDKMKIAISNGTFNKDSYAIRGTCKHFEIPCTYTAIAKFIKGEA